LTGFFVAGLFAVDTAPLQSGMYSVWFWYCGYWSNGLYGWSIKGVL